MSKFVAESSSSGVLACELATLLNTTTRITPKINMHRLNTSWYLINKLYNLPFLFWFGFPWSPRLWESLFLTEFFSVWKVLSVYFYYGSYSAHCVPFKHMMEQKQEINRSMINTYRHWQVYTSAGKMLHVLCIQLISLINNILL